MDLTFRQVESGPSLVSWGFQTVVAFLVPTGLLVVIDSWLEFQDTLSSDLLSYAWVGAGAGVLAILVSKFAKGSVVTGRWVFALPAFAELSLLGWNLFGERDSFRDYFLSAGPGQGEGGWVLALLTVPSWGCCVYSAIMWQRSRVKACAIALPDRPPRNSRIEGE